MSRAEDGLRRRLPGRLRRLEIARVAAELFATDGFSVPTRRISDAIGISQAALYKHFKSKEEIIEEVLRVRFLEEKESDFKRIMDETEGTLLERLS
ncbi:MAG: helix-turn-helix transcriptional regulator, partial [Granulosicoccus sp.]|nr:helix-turn-helix transcriptional regulator [Granulosicoccus sp.]